GWDTKAQASAFSKEEEDVNYEAIGHVPVGDDLPNTENKLNQEEVNKHMDIKEMKEKHSDLLKQIQDDAVTATETEFSTEVTSLKDVNTKLSDKVLNLEKADAIRAANELKMQAERIWDKKLAESDMAVDLQSKARLHVAHTKFGKDGVLDEEAFSKAIDVEIADWIGKGATATVLGAGFHSKEAVGTEAKKLAEEKKGDDGTTKTLLNLAGEKTDKT
ncbi:hypothetical protein LCGC14_3055930, partial [marine sediment metagenome]